MPNAAKNVAVGKPNISGGVYSAPAGTALPTSETTALDAKFQSPGYISDGGVTRSIGRDQSEIVAWGGDVVRKTTTKHDVTYQFEMIETNKRSAGIIYGADNVVETAATALAGAKTTIKITAADLPRGPMVFELKDGARTGRLVLPDAGLGEIGDTTYADESAISYPVTFTAYPDAFGVKAYEYWDDGVKAAT